MLPITCLGTAFRRQPLDRPAHTTISNCHLPRDLELGNRLCVTLKRRYHALPSHSNAARKELIGAASNSSAKRRPPTANRPGTGSGKELHGEDLFGTDTLNRAAGRERIGATTLRNTTGREFVRSDTHCSDLEKDLIKAPLT
jgi:hypothetical protein